MAKKPNYRMAWRETTHDFYAKNIKEAEDIAYGIVQRRVSNRTLDLQVYEKPEDGSGRV